MRRLTSGRLSARRDVLLTLRRALRPSAELSLLRPSRRNALWRCALTLRRLTSGRLSARRDVLLTLRRALRPSAELSLLRPSRRNALWRGALTLRRLTSRRLTARRDVLLTLRRALRLSAELSLLPSRRNALRRCALTLRRPLRQRSGAGGRLSACRRQRRTLDALRWRAFWLHALRLRLAFRLPPAFRLRFALGRRLGEDDRVLRYGGQRVLRDACLRDRDSRKHRAGEQSEANSLVDLFHCERGGHMFLRSIVKIRRRLR